MEILNSVNVALGALTALLTIVVFIVQKQFHRPSISVSLYPDASATLRSQLPGEYRSAPVSSMIYLANLGSLDYGLFALPFYLVNTGKVAIPNVRLQLNYPEWMYVATDSLDQLYRKAKLRSYVADWGRTAIGMGDMTQVNFTLDTLRPGESVVLADMIRIDSKKHAAAAMASSLRRNGGRLNSLYEAGRLLSYFQISATLYADNLNIISKNFEVLAFNTISITELVGWLWSDSGPSNTKVSMLRFLTKKKEQRHLGVVSIPKENFPVNSISGRNRISIHVASQSDWELIMPLPHWRL